MKHFPISLKYSLRKCFSHMKLGIQTFGLLAGFPTNPRGLFVDTTLDGGVQYISNPGGASKKM